MLTIFRLHLRAAKVVIWKPRLLCASIVQFYRFIPDQWWRRTPFFPVVDLKLLRFRSETMYGDEQMAPDADDIAVGLDWCKDQLRKK